MKGSVKQSKIKTVKKGKPLSILVAQAKPENDRSPYFDLEKKYGVALTFCPFVGIEGVSSKEFRKQKIDLVAYTAVVFTSRYAVDHFFRLCDEMRHKVNPEMKYFCISEVIALYLQKFTQYRKRKVFHPADGTITSLIKMIGKQKIKDKLIVPNSDAYRVELCGFLTHHNIEFVEATFFKTVHNDVSAHIAERPDIIVLFSPGGLHSLMHCTPGFQQDKLLIAAFGPATCKAAEEAGLRIDVRAPSPQAPSMVGALEQFLQQQP